MSFSNMTPDPNKHYLCYFCEEEIYFGPLDEKIRKVLFNPESKSSSQEQWRHASDGAIVCRSQATPSNIEVFVD